MTETAVYNQQDLSTEFEKATKELVQLLNSFDQQQINAKPADGGWSAAQVGEHLFKSDSAIIKALHGPSKQTMRAADANVDEINKAFLNFDIQFKSPELILPEDIEHDKEALITAVRSSRELLGKAIKTLDLSATCTDPVMMAIVGEWTRQEYINFVISHTYRHIHQVQKLKVGSQR